MNVTRRRARTQDRLPKTPLHPILDDVLTTSELAARPSRSPDHAAENTALLALADGLTESPANLLKQLANAAIQLTGAGSAGVSVLEDADGDSRSGLFRWWATAGAFARFDGTTTPRVFSPCGIVLDRNATQLMANPARYWPYLGDLTPAVAEVLLVPFYEGEMPVGTLWVVSHDPKRQFDAEDARLVRSLSRFTSAAVRCSKRVAEHECASQAKDRFIAVMSHELRIPLTPALITATAMEADESLAAAARADAGVIRRNIEVETRLIDDLLDISRLATGKVEVRAEPVDLHGLLVQCLEMFRGIATNKGIGLVLEALATRHVVSGDPARLRQVFSNLLGNSIKFTPTGGRVTVATADNDGRVRVTVRDTGIGIPPDMLPRVFDAFEQGGRETTRRYEGLGLGLAIAKGFVEAHGGMISAESVGNGAGATMTVLLPTLTGGEAALSPPLVGVGTEDAPLNILLVEDHEDSLRAMSRLLRRLHHRVETATTILEALSVAERFNFDLLVSDVGLPDGSGLDLMRQLRQQHGEAVGIALTGYGTAADVALTAEAGFKLHLTKPIRFDQLSDALRQVGRAKR